MGAAFVFSPDASYGLVQVIRNAGRMPTVGLRYVAAVTGPWKIFEVVEFDGLDQLAAQAESLSPTAVVIDRDQVRKSIYLAHTAFVRIHTEAADPTDLLAEIKKVIGPTQDGDVEADVVMGDFDILACVVDDDEASLHRKIFDIRRIEGVERTVSLRVIDYVSTSENAEGEHKVEPAC